MLHYQNLDNNLGALLRLVEEAEQQESCEAILAYQVLIDSPAEHLRIEQVDEKAESLLQLLTGIAIDFDVNDAIRDLATMGLVELTMDGWRAISVDKAFDRIKSP